MSNENQPSCQQVIDKLVTAQADNDSAWESSIRVRRSENTAPEEETMNVKDRANKTLEEWAGATYLNLTLVFTDIVDSTRIGIELGDHKWIRELFEHFSRARELASKYDCFVVKSIGDAFMVAFRAAPEAICFAIEFSTNTGVDFIGIRVGINSGHVQIRENDIYGLNVNFTSRVQHALKYEGILVSETDKVDFEKAFGRRPTDIRFVQRGESLKSFGNRTLWQVGTPSWREAVAKQRRARRLILNEESNPSK